MTSLYGCRSLGAGDYRIMKFDEDYNILIYYATTERECDCPAAHRSSCKHRVMLKEFFIRFKHVDDGWFLNWNNRQWHPPIPLEKVQEVALPAPEAPVAASSPAGLLAPAPVGASPSTSWKRKGKW